MEKVLDQFEQDKMYEEFKIYWENPYLKIGLKKLFFEEEPETGKVSFWKRLYNNFFGMIYKQKED